jgi:hypothetical protein
MLFGICRPMVVNERMICHAIIGKNPLKERIMTVDVMATFIAPLLEFSSKKLLFSLYQVAHATCTCTMHCIHTCTCAWMVHMYMYMYYNTVDWEIFVDED